MTMLGAVGGDSLGRVALDGLAEAGVELLEQPLPPALEHLLAGVERPLPVCADESFTDGASLPVLVGRYDCVNIKLDKTGGLTEALQQRDEPFGDYRTSHG